MFFFRRPNLIVDAFVSEKYRYAFDYAPIDYANKFFPDWWKKLPKSKPIFLDDNSGHITNVSNMKTCEGLINEYSNSLIIPMWADLMIERRPDESWVYNCADMQTSVVSHSLDQRAGFKEKYLNCKILSPWCLSSYKNIYFQTTGPYYNYPEELEYENIPGTTDYFYQHGTHINLFVKNKPSEFTISFRTPIAHIKPFSEKKLVLKRHLVTEKEWVNKHNLPQIKFNKKYLTSKSLKQETEKKCPFGFGK